MVTDYTTAGEKREIQKKLFPLIHKRKLVALGGPDIVNYLKIVPSKIKDIEVWENDRKVMMIQMGQISGWNRSISYTFKDIMLAEPDKHAFYDLDFCCSIRKAKPHIERFKKCAFSVTLSLRPISLEETLQQFFDCLGETVIMDIPHPEFNMVTTNKNVYLYTTYYDIWPMLNIFKFHR